MKGKRLVLPDAMSEPGGPPSTWRGLQARMTLSYIWVTFGSMLVFEGIHMMPFSLTPDSHLTWNQLVGPDMIGIIISISLIGGLFGIISTWGLVGRLRTVAAATTRFATGQYDQRLEVVARDEIGQLEAHLNQMVEQLVSHLAQEKILAEHNARLEERVRISRELHDAVSQDLFSLRMLAYSVQEKLPVDSPLHPSIAALEQTATHVIREMRALLLELRPVPLEHLQLADALEELAKTYQTRLGIAVMATITPVPLSMRVEHGLLRIAQEALTNAVRHSYATEILLSLVPQGDDALLSVTDNGKGFSPDQEHAQRGLGLRLMQERVQELHGTFTLRSSPSAGTYIQVSIPQEVGHD